MVGTRLTMRQKSGFDSPVDAFVRGVPFRISYYGISTSDDPEAFGSERLRA